MGKDDICDIVDALALGSSIVLGAKVARYGLQSVSVLDVACTLGLVALSAGFRR